MKIKKKYRLLNATTISIIAIIISIVGVYLQFFNVNHSIVYTTLYPELNSDNKEIIIPILFKNAGNRTEVILSSYLQLEVRNDTSSYYKHISNLKPLEFPLILSPNESKLIKISGNYKDYLFGTFEVEIDESLNPKSMKYQPILIFDNLKLNLCVSYLTNKGLIAEEEVEIGRISFDKYENIDRMDCEPIELKKLNLKNNDKVVAGYFIIPRGAYTDSFSVDLTDSNSVSDYYDKLMLIKN